MTPVCPFTTRPKQKDKSRFKEKFPHGTKRHPGPPLRTCLHTGRGTMDLYCYKVICEGPRSTRSRLSWGGCTNGSWTSRRPLHLSLTAVGSQVFNLCGVVIKVTDATFRLSMKHVQAKMRLNVVSLIPDLDLCCVLSLFVFLSQHQHVFNEYFYYCYYHCCQRCLQTECGRLTEI